MSSNTIQLQNLIKKIKNIYIYDAKTSTKEKYYMGKILMNEEIVVIGSKVVVFLPFQILTKFL